MKKLNNKSVKLAGLVIACATISACEQNFDDPIADNNADYHNGSADFSNYVSIGDSLTAGYADNALYLNGQLNSFPNVLAQQFSKVGGGEFTQPLMDDNLGGLLFAGNESPAFANRYVFDSATKTPGPIEGTPVTEVTNVLTGTFTNMGVPGAKSFHLLSNTLATPSGLFTDPPSANPYFVRFASSATATIIGDAVAQQPSFFTLWVGNNDVLSYATTGGTGVDQTGSAVDPGDYGSDDITNPVVFAQVYTALVATITTGNTDAKGVLVNIPDVKTIPFFKTVPHNPLPLDLATATALNTTAYATYNTALADALSAEAIDQAEHDDRQILFSAALNNAVVIEDEDLTSIPGLPSIRQATADDLLVLTASSKIGALVDVNADPTDPASLRWGITQALEDGDVLIKSEQDKVEIARTAFNATIETAATNNDNLVLFDVAALMNELSTSVNFGTGVITAEYVKGGGFSLDGVHMTARGYTVISNRIIDTINTGFEANIPPVNPGEYSTIFLK